MLAGLVEAAEVALVDNLALVDIVPPARSKTSVDSP